MSLFTDETDSALAAERQDNAAQVAELKMDLVDANATIADQAAEIDTLKARIAALTPPVAVEDWSIGWSTRWFVGQSGDASKVKQQGVRLSSFVEVLDGHVRVHAGPVAEETKVGPTTLATGDVVAALIQWRFPNHYTGGRWEFPAYLSSGYGTRGVILLWPGTGSQSWGNGGGEIDAPERDGNDQVSASLHYGDGHSMDPQHGLEFPLDRWVNVVYRWFPDRFVVELDGTEAATWTNNLPPGPMMLCIQTAVAGGGTSPTWRGKPRVASYVDVGRIEYYADPE